MNSTCKICGCTDDQACIHPIYGNCYWSGPNLCSNCKHYPAEAIPYRQAQQTPLEKGDRIEILAGKYKGRKGVFKRYISVVMPDHCKIEFDLNPRQRVKQTANVHRLYVKKITHTDTDTKNSN